MISPPGRHDELEDFIVEREGDCYRVRVVAGRLSIFRQTPEGESWLDADVPIAQLGGEARRALDMADLTCPALLIGLKGAVAAAITPGVRRYGGRSS